MSAVFEHAKCKDLRGDNPTRDIRAVMPELPDSDGMKAIPNEEVPAAVKAIRESDAKPSARLALELIALTGLRNSEARKATFAEIDLESRIWTVPGLKMKGKKNRPDFRVPLSDRAVEIVLEARSLANGGEYLFPNAKGTNAIAPSYLAATLTQLGIECDVHGFRQNLTNYCAQTGVGDSIRKRLLDHVTGNKVDQAYQTDDLLDQRRAVLDAWADVVGGDTTTNPSGNL